MNEFPAVLLHPRDQCIRKSFSAIFVLPDDGPIKPKHVGVSGFYNINVNLI